MEEKTLIKGKFEETGWGKIFFLTLTVLFWLIGSFLSRVDIDFFPVFAILAVISFFITLIMHFNSTKKCEITVTDKRVYGKTKSGTRVDLPLNQISSIGQSASNCITIATASGVIKFPKLLNIEEVYTVLSDNLNKLQTIEKTPVTITPQSSDADELGKYKKLLDDGAITQEEYDAKKKQILGL